MEHKSEQQLRELQLRSIGNILAGVTHEIKNYAAIIKESAGLIGDMIKLGKTDKNILKQYMEIIQSIEDQIEKTTRLLSYLNRYAHRMDMPVSSFSVNDSIDDLMALLNRLANQRKVSFEKDFQKDLPAINSNPSLLQFILYCCLLDKIMRLDRNGKLFIKTSLSDGSLQIKISTHGDLMKEDIEKSLCPDDIYSYVINQLNGDIIKEKGETLIKLPLSLK